MTAAEWFMEQGREEGRDEGKYTMLLHLLKQKFGLVPLRYRKRIEQANGQQLLNWGERVLEVQNLEALFEE